MSTSSPSDDVCPDLEALGQFAQTECLGTFEPYVGVGAFDSEQFYTWFVPTLDSWTTPRTARSSACSAVTTRR